MTPARCLPTSMRRRRRRARLAKHPAQRFGLAGEFARAATAAHAPLIAGRQINMRSCLVGSRLVHWRASDFIWGLALIPDALVSSEAR